MNMRVIFVLAISLFFYSCDGSRKKSIQVQTERESINEKGQNTPEKFKDFLKMFSQDSAFQFNRVVFPLVLQGYSQPVLKELDWRYDSVYRPMEIIWGIYKKTPNEQDLQDSKIVVNYSKDLTNSTTYFFKRIEQKWYLSKKKSDKEIKNLICREDGESETFVSFINLFSNDSIFQTQRIKFPLIRKELDLDGKIDSVKIERSNYRFLKFWQNEDAEILSIINNDSNDSNTLCGTTIALIASGFNFNNVHVEYYFRYIQGKWYLADIVDLST
jgi:hypothetical protein